MRAPLFGAIIVKPINFPDDLDILPLRVRDGTRTGQTAYAAEEYH